MCSQDSRLAGPAQPASAPRVLVAVAVVLHDGSVLVGRRDKPPLAGLAEFPGGKVLPRESPESAAVREVREEAGIEVRVERALADVPADYPHASLELRFYLCRPVEARPSGNRLREPDAAATSPAERPAPRSPFRWIPLSELDRLEFPSANAAVLQALRRLDRD